MPSGDGQERERFAAAVERGLGAVPPGDDQLRQELDLVALLRESRASLAPSADASARMRARVMAAAASMMTATENGALDHTSTVDTIPHVGSMPLVDAPATPGSVAAQAVRPAEAPTEFVNAIASGSAQHEQQTNVVSIGRARGRHRTAAAAKQRPSRNRRGLLGIGAAAAVMLVAVTGGGAMFSQGALPGDSLYGVKQASESAMVGLTPGQDNKAQRQLDYAATRIDEVQQLNQQQTTASDKNSDITQALKGFNEQTTSGSRMSLSGSGASNKAELGALSSWAESQSQKLSTMRSSMPASAQPDADHSMRVLEDVRTRSQSLSNRQGCDKITSGESDDLGPLPAKGACTAKDSTPAPSIRSSLPSEPSRSSAPSSETKSGSSGSEKSSKSSKSEQKDAPDLSGGSHTGDLPKLPGNAPSKNDVLPQPQQNPNPLEPLLKPLMPQSAGQPPAPGAPAS
jgi:hypothetical protein